MSGFLRRIKRSRASAGETPAEGQFVAPEGAPPTAATPAGGQVRAEPAIAADPDVPAGLDPAEAALQPPRGRRGRLRRRLRYLRRARELMLRDLGGLLYEVHRSGTGDVRAHDALIRAKVQRLASLDAEAHAIETALASPRSESVVFQPGVGGTCATCGELYGSAARFCSHCGSPAGAAAEPAPVPPAARPVPPVPRETDDKGEQATQVLAPGEATDTPPAKDEQRGGAEGNPLGNGRAEGHTPPDRSPGDPLARESRS